MARAAPQCAHSGLLREAEGMRRDTGRSCCCMGKWSMTTLASSESDDDDDEESPSPSEGCACAPRPPPPLLPRLPAPAPAGVPSLERVGCGLASTVCCIFNC